jgi:hypothetical protein
MLTGRSSTGAVRLPQRQICLISRIVVLCLPPAGVLGSSVRCWLTPDKQL